MATELDKKQQKHLAASIYHQKAFRTFTNDPLNEDWHRRMSHLHAIHGGLDSGNIWNEGIRVGSDLPTVPEKNHEHDSLLPADADRMMQGWKHHILEREKAQDDGDSDRARYHQHFVDWHTAMLGESDYSESVRHPGWTPEEIKDAEQHLAERKSEYGAADPVNFGTEIFPKYQHSSVARNIKEKENHALEKNPYVRPDDLAQAYTTGKKDEKLGENHPFLPDKHKLEVIKEDYGRKNHHYHFENHNHPELTKRVIKDIEKEHADDPEEMGDKLRAFLSNRTFDQGLSEYALKHDHPEVRGLGLMRLNKESDRYKTEYAKEKQKLENGETGHSLKGIIGDAPLEDIHSIMENAKGVHGTSDNNYKVMLNSITSRYDLDDKKAADIVGFLARNHPDRLGHRNLQRGLHHLKAKDVDLGALPYSSLKPMLESKNLSPEILGKLVDHHGPLVKFLRHPNMPREKLDELRDTKKESGHSKLARELISRPNHTREDLDFAKKHLLNHDPAPAGGPASMADMFNGVNKKDRGSIQNSPHWTNNELADIAADPDADNSWVATHPNASPQLLHDLAVEYSSLHSDILGNPNASPGTVSHLASFDPKNAPLHDARLPIQKAIEIYDSDPKQHYHQLIEHPFLPEDKAKEMVEKHSFGNKPNALPAAALQHIQVAPPASVPNVRKDKLTYEMIHKPGSTAIENIAKEFKKTPNLKWSEVKRAYPYLEHHPEVRKIFEGKPELSEQEFNDRVQALPDKKFHVSYRKWVGGQRHNSAPQLVVQMNAGSGFRKELAKEPGLLDAFDHVKDKLYARYHPVLPHSIGWARVDTSHPKHWFIDEIQSDIDANLKQHWDENIRNLGKKTDRISEKIKGWNEHLIQHVANIAKQHGVEKLSIHSKKSKMRANHGLESEDKPSSKYEEIYSKAPRNMGFKTAKAGDHGFHERSTHLKHDTDIHTLDLASHIPVASNGPKEMGKPISRQRKADKPALFAHGEVGVGPIPQRFLNKRSNY